MIFRHALNSFCETYNIDAFRCADELFNFARSCEKFNYSTVSEVQDDDDDDEDDDDYDDDYDDDDDMRTMMRGMTTTSQARQLTRKATAAPRKLKTK